MILKIWSNLPIVIKEEGDTCSKCNKRNTEVGKITYYTSPYDGYKGLLCSKCIKRREKPYKEKCPKCKRLAYKHGGMSFYGEPPDIEKMCLECVEKKEKKVAKKNARNLTIKNFFKKRWTFLIMATIGIIGIIIAYSKF